jgi:hypothetical protein
LKANAPGRLEKVRRLEFNQFCDHSFLERCLNEHISGAYTRRMATYPGRNVGCYYWHHKPPFECVAQFPGSTRSTFGSMLPSRSIDLFSPRRSRISKSSKLCRRLNYFLKPISSFTRSGLWKKKFPKYDSFISIDLIECKITT